MIHQNLGIKLFGLQLLQQTCSLQLFKNSFFFVTHTHRKRIQDRRLDARLFQTGQLIYTFNGCSSLLLLNVFIMNLNWGGVGKNPWGKMVTNKLHLPVYIQEPSLLHHTSACYGEWTCEFHQIPPKDVAMRKANTINNYYLIIINYQYLV